MWEKRIENATLKDNRSAPAEKAEIETKVLEHRDFLISGSEETYHTWTTRLGLGIDKLGNDIKAA